MPIPEVAGARTVEPEQSSRGWKTATRLYLGIDGAEVKWLCRARKRGIMSNGRCGGPQLKIARVFEHLLALDKAVADYLECEPYVPVREHDFPVPEPESS